VFSNLIGNALRYTQEGGTIRIGLKDQGAFVAFWVQDTGVGIPKEQQEAIFHRFSQIEGSGPSGRLESGLRSREMWSRPTAAEYGSRAYPVQAPRFSSPSQKVLHLRDDNEKAYNRSRRRGRPKHGACHFLVSEKQGFLVNTAHDGLEALLLAHKLRPDLVLLDMVIPKVSGTLVAKALKEDPRTCQVKIIMISANPNIEGLEGAEHVLIKPFEPNELLDAVHTTLNTF